MPSFERLSGSVRRRSKRIGSASMVSTCYATFVASEHAPSKYSPGRSPARQSALRVEPSSQHGTILQLSLSNCGQVATPL